MTPTVKFILTEIETKLWAWDGLIWFDSGSRTQFETFGRLLDSIATLKTNHVASLITAMSVTISSIGFA